MSHFLSGIYSRFTTALGSPSEPETGVSKELHATPDSGNDESSRTLSPVDHDGTRQPIGSPQRSAILSQLPPTPFLAAPATPFGGLPSPVHNAAAAQQLRFEADSSQGAQPPPTPFFAPPTTPFNRNPSPIRNEAAAQQLRQEMLGEVPETPAPSKSLAQPAPTPMTQYLTPAMPKSTPAVPSTAEQPDFTTDTPTASFTSNRQNPAQSPVAPDQQPFFNDIDLSSVTEVDSQQPDSGTSSPAEADEQMHLSDPEVQDMDTSSTSISSSEAETRSRKTNSIAIPQHKSRKPSRRNQRTATSKSYDDRKTRVKKPTRPGMSRSVSGREELLNKARKRFWDRKAERERLF